MLRVSEELMPATNVHSRTRILTNSAHASFYSSYKHSSWLQHDGCTPQPVRLLGFPFRVFTHGLSIKWPMRCDNKTLRSDPGLFNHHALCDATSKNLEATRVSSRTLCCAMPQEKLRSNTGSFNKHGLHDATSKSLAATPVS